MNSTENLTKEIKRLAHKNMIDDKELKENNVSLSSIGEKYISELEFFFCPLNDKDIVDNVESYLINQVKKNNDISYKLFFINDVIPEQYEEVECVNEFLDNVKVNL